MITITGIGTSIEDAIRTALHDAKIGYADASFRLIETTAHYAESLGIRRVIFTVKLEPIGGIA